MKHCLDCGAEKSPKGRYCKNCGYKHRVRPCGLIYVKHKENPTSFKKGMSPWNKGLVGMMKAWNKGIKGTHFSPKTEFKKGNNVGVLNTKWKGEFVSYVNLHMWLYRHLRKNGICRECGKSCRTHWSNISHAYKRDFDDFVELCPRCHARYDHGLIKLECLT